MIKFLLAVLFAFFVNATILDDANKEFKDRNYKEALRLYKQAALSKNNVLAMSNIANMYYTGTGVLKDTKKAFKWYKKAAKYDDALSMYNISLMYENGTGTTKSKTEAFKWCQRAAKGGLLVAKYKLGLMYIVGFGTQKNMSLAKTWINKAIDGGLVQAKTTYEKHKLWQY